MNPTENVGACDSHPRKKKSPLTISAAEPIRKNALDRVTRRMRFDLCRPPEHSGEAQSAPHPMPFGRRLTSGAFGGSKRDIMDMGAHGSDQNRSPARHDCRPSTCPRAERIEARG